MPVSSVFAPISNPLSPAACTRGPRATHAIHGVEAGSWQLPLRFLLTAPRPARCSLPAACCGPALFRRLPPARCLLPAARRLPACRLPAACRLAADCCLLPAAGCLTAASRRLLLTQN